MNSSSCCCVASCLTNYQTKLLLRGETTGFFYGDYKVLYLIGTGTFARVYRACHRTTGEIVAVKVLRRRFSDDPEQADRFYREGQMGATLKHPNIVPIMDVYSQKGDALSGNAVRRRAQPARVHQDSQKVRSRAGHATGGRHGRRTRLRLCPGHLPSRLQNVQRHRLQHGQAMLLDFGLAGGDKQINDDSMQNPRTIDYAGLERATGVRKDDSRSDIYFLGCIFYHMLTGTAADLSKPRIAFSVSAAAGLRTSCRS